MTCQAALMRALWGLCGAAPNIRKFSYTVDLLNYAGNTQTVTESTEVNIDEKRMLTMATDVAFGDTPFYRATIMHDFNVDRMAIKPLGARHCFVAPVRMNFDDTLKELEDRTTGAAPQRTPRTMVVRCVRSSRSAGSRELRSFCRRRWVFFVDDINLDNIAPIRVRWAPMDSISGQVDVYRELISGPIEGERDVPLFIRSFVGPNAPFA